MKSRMYTVKDHKFKFSDIFLSPEDSTAVRYFGMVINNNKNNANVMAYAPADFDLFCVGTFDTENGQVDPIWPVEFIVNGSSVVGE